MKALFKCGSMPGSAEYTICGSAYDAYETGDAEEPIEIAKAGETFTCPRCRDIVKRIKAIRYYVEPEE